MKLLKNVVSNTGKNIPGNDKALAINRFQNEGVEMQKCIKHLLDMKKKTKQQY